MAEQDPSRPTNDPWLERTLIGQPEEVKRRVRMKQALVGAAETLNQTTDNETGEQNG